MVLGGGGSCCVLVRTRRLFVKKIISTVKKKNIPGQAGLECVSSPFLVIKPVVVVAMPLLLPSLSLSSGVGRG